ncbi:MAG: type II toxin-antitoxin system death-on-curing family toxin [Candidatus Helarchaeota archaeon]|nr:type II toxin-antitoxin system death-on-curing family toxin [Candidatus Helarchaeota archaeon]
MAISQDQEIKYLEKNDILDIYKNIMKHYSRVHKISHTEKIDEILKSAKQHTGDIFEKASVLIKELVTAKPRPFVDGHKRVAWISAVRFLEINGYHFFDFSKLEDMDFIGKSIVLYLVQIQQKRITNINQIRAWLLSLFIQKVK